MLTIQYTGQLANLIGASEETMEVGSDETVVSLARKIAGKYGKGCSDLLLAGDGQLRPSLLVIFDGEQIDGEVSSRKLDEVSTVMLMTPIAGG